MWGVTPIQSPGYGHYCGPRCWSQFAPVDCMDAACKEHDKCMASIWEWLDLNHKQDCEIIFCKQVNWCWSEGLYHGDCISALPWISAYACASASFPNPWRDFPVRPPAGYGPLPELPPPDLLPPILKG
jgi:hypothetical protein